MIARKKLGFRAWFYFRQGWTTYFAFIFAAVNTMVTTYYLAIENIPALKTVFPSFFIYVSVIAGLGIPFLVFVGYVHYKRSSAYSAEADINVESYPYFYKLQPGWTREVVFPLYGIIAQLLVKISKNEKITDEELSIIKSIEEKINLLVKGGYVGSHREKTDEVK